MTRRFVAFAATSLFASGAMAGLGALPAAAAPGAPGDLLTSGQPCVRQTPGPYLSPDRLNDARAVVLQGTYAGDTGNTDVQADFEVWDVADPGTRQQWLRGVDPERKRVYVQLEDDSRQLDGVTYAWRVRVLDGADASPWSDTCHFTVDRTGGDAPAVSSDDYPADSYGRGGIGVPGRFTLTSPSDDTVGYEYRFSAYELEGDAEWVTVDAPRPGAPVTITLTPVAANSHTLTVYAVDRAGNRSEVVHHGFSVRDTRPAIFSAAYPETSVTYPCCANLQYNVGVPGEFSLDGTDDSETLEWRIDQGGPSGSVAANDDGDAVVSIAPTRAGAQTLFVRGVTADGTRYPERSYHFLVDNGPAVTGDVDRSVVIGSTLVLRAAPRMPGTVAYDYWLSTYSDDGSGNKVAVPAQSDGSADIRIPMTSSDVRAVHVQGRTANGTRSVARQVGVSVDGAAPSVTRSGGGELETTARFVARSTMTGIASYTIRFNGDAATQRVLKPAADGSVTFDYTPVKVGYHYVHVWATNTAGVRSDDGGASWNVSNGPKVTSADFPAGGVGRLATGTFTFTPRLPVATWYEYSFNNGPEEQIDADADGSATLTWTPPAAGDYTLQVRSYRGSASSQLTTHRFRVAAAGELLPKPVATHRPAISGSVTVGGVVRIAPGTWSPAATGFRYQWAANGAAIRGATGASLTVPAAAAGKRLTVTVTATRSGHATGTAVSSASAVVAKGKAPRATTKPRISGTAKTGRKLTATVGTWSPRADSYRYEWRVNGKLIKGASSRTLKVKSSWRNKRITVTVVAKKAGHTDGRAVSTARKIR